MRVLVSNASGFIGHIPVRERSDKALIEAVCRGSHEDYGELLSRYQDQVFSMVMRQVGAQDIAAELTQDTFVRAYEALPGFRFESTFGTWITRIALNLTNSYFSSKRYKTKFKEEELHLEKHDRAEQSTEQIEEEQRARALRKAVGRLKPHYRDVVVMCGFEGRTYEETAETLQIPVGTVRSRLNMARNLLREALTSEKENGK